MTYQDRRSGRVTECRTVLLSQELVDWSTGRAELFKRQQQFNHQLHPTHLSTTTHNTTGYTPHTRSTRSSRSSPDRARAQARKTQRRPSARPDTRQERVYRACWLFRKTRTHTRQPCPLASLDPGTETPPTWSTWEVVGAMTFGPGVCSSCVGAVGEGVFWQAVVRCVWRRGKKGRKGRRGAEWNSDWRACEMRWARWARTCLCRVPVERTGRQSRTRGSDGGTGGVVRVWCSCAQVFRCSGVRSASSLLLWRWRLLAASHLTRSRCISFIWQTHRDTESVPRCVVAVRGPGSRGG